MALNRQIHFTVTGARGLLAAWAESQRAPLWVSLCLVAVARADEGRSEWEAGELAGLFMVRRERVSEAITQAVRAGWLDPSSTSARLVLADA